MNKQYKCKKDDRYYIDKSLVENVLKDKKYKEINIEDIINIYRQRKWDSNKIFSVKSLLTTPENNRFKFSSNKKVYTLNLLPAFSHKKIKSTCPKAGYCKDICVGISKQGKLQNFKFLIRTLYVFYFDKRNNFLCLKKEINDIIKDWENEIEKKINNIIKHFKNNTEKRISNIINFCKNRVDVIYFRLNNYSDIAWEEQLGLEFYNEIGEKYGEKVKFYDYTKIKDRYIKFLEQKNWPKNYYLSYSYDKKNEKDFKDLIKKISKENIDRLSISFIIDKNIKKNIEKFKCKNSLKEFAFIDGDENDIRADDFECKKYKNKIKIVLLEYNKTTGLTKKSEEDEYYLSEKELMKKINYIKGHYDSLSKH